MNIYWRNEYTDPQSVTPYPEDFAAVAGDAMASELQDKWIVNWQCVDDVLPKYETPGPDQNYIPPSCDMPIDDVCHGTGSDPCSHEDPIYLRMVITFPECIVLSAVKPTALMQSPDEYFYNMTGRETPSKPHGGMGYYNCPDGYIEIPTIQIDPHWLINKGPNVPLFAPVATITSGVPPQPYLHFDLSNLLLSSDLVMDRKMSILVTPGLTSHADYENGYSQAELDGLVAMCFHTDAPTGQNCGSI